MLHSAFLVDEAIFKWGQAIKEMMTGGENQLTLEMLEALKLELEEILDNLKLYEYFQLSSDLEELMLSFWPPSKPS